MKRLLSGLLFLFLPTFVFGAGAIIGVDDPAKVCGTASAKICGVGITPAASSCSYVHCNGFETQADDDDWTTEGGTPDYDNAYVLEGSECMELGAGDSVSIVVSVRAETWITFMLRTNDNNESTEILAEFYNNTTLLGKLSYDNDNKMFVTAEGGTPTATETVGISTGIKYIKLRFKQGTGANAELEFWASSDGTSWGNNLSSTDGTTTAQVNKILIQNTHDNEIMRVDNFMENSADITDAR